MIGVHCRVVVGRAVGVVSIVGLAVVASAALEAVLVRRRRWHRWRWQGRRRCLVALAASAAVEFASATSVVRNLHEASAEAGRDLQLTVI